MNYVIHINHALKAFAEDERISPHHVSLYMAIFRQWNRRRFPKFFSLRRKYIMASAKIYSKSTYHRKLRELHHWGYLVYFPSHGTNPGSQVRVLEFKNEGVPGRPSKERQCPTGGQPSYYIKHKTIKTLFNSREEEFKNAFENKNIDKDQQLYFLDWLDHEEQVPRLERLKARELVDRWSKEFSISPVAVSQDKDHLKVKKLKRYDQPL